MAVVLISCVTLTIMMFMYSQVIFIMIEDLEIGIIQAMRISRLMMKGNKRRMLGLGFSMIGWTFLVYLSMGIAILWVIPYMASVFTHFHLTIRMEQWMNRETMYEKEMAI